ncbi:glycosyltransferase [Flavobacteriaceae bacterium F89]|uniref:Glycosyltransferase n=1 Tax=Cerina litoralis TaxID=2874477 RepID=A0AAE3F055_9FLAO|nr:glycosyltransferase family 2 protein [Cerina litoralis]MCG2462877.1 glycosyltransferase [Cerina litoralis]
MKISIITATYHSEATIEACMDSVLGQGYSDLEYLILDGGSKDGTMARIQQCVDPRVRVISEPDQGIYDALNKGIAMATGEVIGFVHSDDFLASDDCLANMLHLFESEKVDGVYGDLHYVDAQETARVVRNWKSKPFHRALLRRGWMPAHPTLFLKKEVYDKHGVFNLEFKIAADYDMMLRIFKDDTLKFAYLPQVVTKMRLGGVSNGSLKSIIRKTREDYKAMKYNQLSNPLYTICAKNLSKIPQFFTKG